MFFWTFMIGLVVQAQIENQPLKVGEMAPVIIGIDQFGKKFDSKSVLKNSKILLIFYRGNWCPHCKKHLANLEENLSALYQKGVSVVVVTPESLEKTKETTEEWKTTFPIIHDQGNQIMNDYQVSFEVNEKTVGKYYDPLSKKLSEYNDKGNMVLPVPATYLIDQKGRIEYVHFDPDYKNRSDFDEILGLL